MKKFFVPTTDKTRAVATFVTLMLLWPLALAASYGATLQPLGLSETVPMCSAFGLPQKEGEQEPTLTKPCPMCLASSHAALDGPAAVPLPSFPPAVFSVACGAQSVFKTAVVSGYQSRAPPLFL